MGKVGISFLCIILILLSASTAASDYEWVVANSGDSDVFNYGEKIKGAGSNQGAEIYVKCEGGGNGCWDGSSHGTSGFYGSGEDNAGPGYRFEFCGNTVKGEYSSSADAVLIQDGRVGGSINIGIPKEASCGLGWKDVRLRLKPGAGGDEITFKDDLFRLDPKGGQHPNVGHRIYTEFHRDGRFKQFFLTNYTWEDNNNNAGGFKEFPNGNYGDPINDKGAYLFISEADRGGDLNKDDNYIFYSTYAAVISPEDDNLWHEMAPPNALLKIYRDDPKHDEDENIHETLKRSFGSPETNFDDDCDLSTGNNEWTPPKCAPLHQDGNYKPISEIIVASPLEDYSLDPKGPDYEDTTDEEVSFFVCRNSPGYPWEGSEFTNPLHPSQASNPDAAAKVVKAMFTDHTYFYCNEEGDWKRVNCGIGLEFRKEGSGGDAWGCHPKARPMIDVNFLDIKNVTESKAKSGYIAGFRINRSEYEKFTNLYTGRPIRKVQAICWMGDDDTEPTHHNKALKVIDAREQYNEGGDIWVLLELPFRDGVYIGTYSCTFGFQNTNGDPSIFEGTSPDVAESSSNFLGAKDSGTIEVYYEDIRDHYGSISPSDSPFPFGDYDTSSISYIDEGQEDPYDTPDEEAPYCDSDVLGDIYCDGTHYPIGSTTNSLIQSLQSLLS